jgi:taurine--2-oxoglutarate transaminase
MSDYFYTWCRQRDATPIAIARGQGATFETADGRTWLDLASLSYQANLGHGRRDMAEALAKQARELTLVPPNAEFPAKSEAAHALLELAGGDFAKVFFTLGGAEANENAMKMARLFTGRHKMLSRYRSYHGATMGALSLTGDYRRPPLEPGLPGVVRFLGDDPDRLRETMELEGRATIAAVILETIPGANGVHLPRSGFLKAVREICDDHGTLLIADEVLTGFGRTGRAFAFEHEGVVPDLITCAKGLTGGYAPLGAVVVSQRVADFFEDHFLYAGLTGYGHPLGCAAARAAMTAYRAEDLFERAAALETTLLERLESLSASVPQVSAARGRGLLAAVDLDLSSAQWQTFSSALRDRALLIHAAEARGTAILAPPLVIEEDQLIEGIERLRECLEEAVK